MIQEDTASKKLNDHWEKQRVIMAKQVEAQAEADRKKVHTGILLVQLATPITPTFASSCWGC